jgi:hypothetical protein
MSPARRRLTVDLGLSALLVATFATREGPARLPHAIAGGAMAGLAVFHVTQHRAWVRSVWARRAAHPQRRLALLNLGLAAAYALTVPTGALAWWQGGAFATVHVISGFTAIVLSLTHLAMNRRDLVRLARPRPGRTSPSEA